MTDPAQPLTPDQEKLVLELYKTAFARLNFQDEYLFKFSTVFLTVHGALAVLAGSVVFRGATPNYAILTILSGVGIFLSSVWFVWTRHNDYWHSIWVGTLRQIEGRLQAPVRVFDAVHADIARAGGRKPRFVLRGHTIAASIPAGFILAWGMALFVSLCERG